MRLVVTLLCMFVLLAGCTTGEKKQAVKSQSTVLQRTYQQEKTDRNYDYEDSFSAESYGQAIAKSPVNVGVQLSQKQIQRALKNSGFYQGSIDGKIGSRTREAIVRFQKAKGLKADGIVGKRTSLELNKYLN